MSDVEKKEVKEHKETEKPYTWKRRFLDISEVIDSYRLFPRGILLGYAILGWEIVHWGMDQGPGITTQQMGLVSAVTALFIPITMFYMQSGKNYTHKEPKEKHQKTSS